MAPNLFPERSFLKGAIEEAIEQDAEGFSIFEDELKETDQTYEPDLIAQLFLQHRKFKMQKSKVSSASVLSKQPSVILPTARRKPVKDPWQFAYLITGEKKIGKTTFAIEGCEELVLQFDKPQLAYDIREEVISTWKQSMAYIKALEEKAASGSFLYERIVIDGVAEWYAMCQDNTCRHFGIEHPSEEGYARGWHHLRDEFNGAVNRLLRLQNTVGCGVMFICHAEWKERSIRGGGKVEKLVPNMPSTCEEIVNGKVDGWFVYDYVGEDRVLVVRGDQTTGAGHRIDGHFMTTTGERVREIHMGNSASEALQNFLQAFRNEQDYATYSELETRKRIERTNKLQSKIGAKKRAVKVKR